MSIQIYVYIHIHTCIYRCGECPFSTTSSYIMHVPMIYIYMCVTSMCIYQYYEDIDADRYR